MKHFYYLTERERKEIFYLEPEVCIKECSKEELAVSLGALMYMPSTRLNWEEDIKKEINEGVTSISLDLEDAIEDGKVESGIENIVRGFSKIDNRNIPSIFIRIREKSQIESILVKLGNDAHKLKGFIIPKFDSSNGNEYLKEIRIKNNQLGLNLYCMPVLESSRVMYKETRLIELLEIKRILDLNRDIVLNVRVGATDFTSMFGLRRTLDSTVYDISVVRDCLVDIVNVLSRSAGGYVISGPVWEFFENKKRVLKPQIRVNLFRDSYGEDGIKLREHMINEHIDNLVKEIIMDKINGFTGKTVIHPTHIKPVNSLLAVTYEEYLDAKLIVENKKGGVLKSSFNNKMNEVKPHMNWAKNIMIRSRVYGVLKEERTFVDLLS